MQNDTPKPPSKGPMPAASGVGTTAEELARPLPSGRLRSLALVALILTVVQALSITIAAFDAQKLPAIERELTELHALRGSWNSYFDCMSTGRRLRDVAGCRKPADHPEMSRELAMGSAMMGSNPIGQKIDKLTRLAVEKKTRIQIGAYSAMAAAAVSVLVLVGLAMMRRTMPSDFSLAPQGSKLVGDLRRALASLGATGVMCVGAVLAVLLLDLADVPAPTLMPTEKAALVGVPVVVLVVAVVAAAIYQRMLVHVVDTNLDHRARQTLSRLRLDERVEEASIKKDIADKTHYLEQLRANDAPSEVVDDAQRQLDDLVERASHLRNQSSANAIEAGLTETTKKREYLASVLKNGAPQAEVERAREALLKAAGSLEASLQDIGAPA